MHVCTYLHVKVLMCFAPGLLKQLIVNDLQHSHAWTQTPWAYSVGYLFFSYLQNFRVSYQLHICFSDSCQWWTVPIPVQSTFLYSCRRYVIQCPPLGRGVSGQQSRRGHETFLLLLCGIRSWPPGHNMLTTQHTLVHTTLVRGRCKFISSSCELILRFMDEASNPAR